MISDLFACVIDPDEIAVYRTHCPVSNLSILTQQRTLGRFPDVFASTMLPLFLRPLHTAGMQIMPIPGPTWLMALATVACWISKLREMKHRPCRRP